MDDLTLQLIRDKESFRRSAYWDVTAWRVGYGSDTWTDENGKVHKVTKDTVVTRDQAERDLARRVPEFQKKGVIAYVGETAWSRLSSEAKAAVTSLAYNYGSIANLRTVKRAIVSGDSKKLADAIQARGTDNNGVNAKRRAEEAALVLSAKSTSSTQNLTDQRAEQETLRKQVKPPMPRPRPDAKAPMVPSHPLLVAQRPFAPKPAGGLVTRTVKTVPIDPMTGNPIPAPAAKPAVTAQNKSTAQIRQEADNGRLSGYRSIQEMGPSSKGSPSKPKPPPENVTKTADGIAGTVQLPRDVVPASVRAAGYGTGSVLTTPKSTASGNIQSQRDEQLGQRKVAGAAAVQRHATAQADQARLAAQKQAADQAAKAAAQQAAAQRASAARAAAQQAAAAKAAALAAMKRLEQTGTVIGNAIYGKGGTDYGSSPGQSTAGLKPGDRVYNADTNSWGLKR